LIRRANFFHFFRDLPQGSFIVHSFRTDVPRFFIDEQFGMRESAFTAGVDVTLPAIVQGWFCSSWPEGKLLRFPKRASVAGDPGVAASSERFRMAGLQPANAIGCNYTFGCIASP
jgi:hypothetical protein